MSGATSRVCNTYIERGDEGALGCDQDFWTVSQLLCWCIVAAEVGGVSLP